jgi:hypothetical protein
MIQKFFAVVVILALSPLNAEAQDYRARITGTVLDIAGAIVPGASVEIMSQTTGLSYTTTTNDAGVYLIQFLEPGIYKLTVSKSGFRTYIAEGITLETNRSLGRDVRLEIGGQTETVTVTAESATIETESASRTMVVNQKMVQELPLAARNPVLFANLLPGSTFRGAAVFRQPFANGAIANFTINGGQPSQNEFLVDGAPNNSRAAGLANNIAYIPVAEAVREVTILSNTYDASYGKTTGGIINVVMRGGTSQHHLTGWGFLQRQSLNANTFVNNAFGTPRARQNVNQYGVQGDGPIPLPRFLSAGGKLKLFYLGTYEKYTELQPAPLRNSVPEPEMRRGDFSKLRNAAGELIQIYDPIPAGYDANGNPIRAPFPGNIIPEDRLNPVALKVASFIPMPNTPTPANQRYSQNNFYLPDYSFDFDFHNIAGRVDAQIGENDRVYFRYGGNKHTQVRTVNGILNAPGENSFNPFLRENSAYLADWVRTINPRTVLNVRLNVARYVEGTQSQGNFGFDATTLGLPASVIKNLAVDDYFGTWQFQNYLQLGSTISIETNNTYSLAGNLSTVRGSHNLKAGVDARRLHYLVTALGNPYRFNFTSAFTRETWNVSGTEIDSGDSFSSFLLGAPADGSADFNVRPFWRQWYVAPYIQNDWKVSRRLTLNLGLRYDLNTPPGEKHNRLNVGFDFGAISPLAGLINASPEALAVNPNLNALNGGLRFANVDGYQREASKRYLNTLQPRIGVAYQIAERLVLRGGYGVYYANWTNNAAFQTAGFSISTPFNASTDGGRTPIGGLAGAFGNPYPNGIARPPGASDGLNTFVGRNFDWWNQRAKLPRVQHFSFGLQYQLTNQSTIDLSYVGSRTTDNITSRAFNLPSDNFVAQCDPARGGDPGFCNALVANPFHGLAAFAETPLGINSRVSRSQLARPYPQFNGNLVEQGRNDGKLWYDSLQFVYRMRLTKGAVIDANYVFSKQIEQGGWMNEYAGIPQKGLYFTDRPHVFKLSAHLELPFGKGKRWGAKTNGFVSRLIGGWDVNAFYSIQSGEPADLPGRAVMLRDPKVKVDRGQFQVRGWNGCVLQRNADGTRTPMAYSVQRNGCSPTDFSQYAWEILPQGFDTFRVNQFRSGQIRMPSYRNIDLSLNKSVQITERLRFQFRAEAFNAFNRFNVFSVRYNTNPFDPNFGTYFPAEANAFSGQQRDSQPRSVRLGFKLMW